MEADIRASDVEKDIARRDEGQTVVEYVLVIVLFILLLFLALEAANLSNVLDTSADTLQDHLKAE